MIIAMQWIPGEVAELLFFALLLDGARRFAVWIYKLIKKK